MLKTDYVDLLYFHHLGDRKVDVAMEPEGVLTWLVKQKQAGKIRFVGISGHNRPGRFARFLNSGLVDVLLTIVNFADRFTYKFEQDVLPVAQKNNVGIVAMKVFGGSRNMNYADPQCPPQLDVKYLDLAVRYALEVPGVGHAEHRRAQRPQLRRNVELVRKPPSPDCRRVGAVPDAGERPGREWGLHFRTAGPATVPAARLGLSLAARLYRASL